MNSLELDTTLGDKNATLDDLMSIGICFFGALNGHPSTTSMNQARYLPYVNPKKPPSIELLPPADIAICSVHVTKLLCKAENEMTSLVLDFAECDWQ